MGGTYFGKGLLRGFDLTASSPKEGRLKDKTGFVLEIEQAGAQLTATLTSGTGGPGQPTHGPDFDVRMTGHVGNQNFVLKTLPESDPQVEIVGRARVNKKGIVRLTAQITVRAFEPATLQTARFRAKSLINDWRRPRSSLDARCPTHATSRRRAATGRWQLLELNARLRCAGARPGQGLGRALGHHARHFSPSGAGSAGSGHPRRGR